ncbi:MAG: chalcone isomerase family protein [Chromatiales bacterium]|nr:chalcone isomerase family protein [Chromatiales bacterium]
MKITRITLFLLLFFLTSLGWAYDIAGVSLPDKQRVSDESTELMLNGAGVRSKFFFKIYVAGLYLAQPMDSLQAIEQNRGPKRVAMHFLYDKVEKKKLDDGWWDGFKANLSSEAFTRLQPQIETFVGFFKDAHKGDRIWLDYLPGTGTVVSVNGERVGAIPGDQFYPALLRIWLGEKPVTSSLKKAMLGSD